MAVGVSSWHFSLGSWFLCDGPDSITDNALARTLPYPGLLAPQLVQHRRAEWVATGL